MELPLRYCLDTNSPSPVGRLDVECWILDVENGGERHEGRNFLVYNGL